MISPQAYYRSRGILSSDQALRREIEKHGRRIDDQRGRFFELDNGATYDIMTGTIKTQDENRPAPTFSVPSL
jgi:hypothetical protein